MDIRQILSLTQATEVDGIYIYEIDPPKFIQGRTMSIVGLVGEFERGPVAQVVRIGDAATFRRTFGGYGTAPVGSESTWRGYSGFRAVVGKSWGGLRIVRPENDEALPADAVFDLVTHVVGPPVTQGRQLTLTAASPGRYGGRITATVRDASDASLTNGFALTITLDSESESVDNLHAAMTTAELRARFASAGVTIATPSIIDNPMATKDIWPQAYPFSGEQEGAPTLAAWTAAVDKLLANREVSILFCAEPPGDPVTAAALNAYIKSQVSPALGGGVPVMAVLAGDAGEDIEAASVEAALYRGDRLIYTWPHRKQLYAAAANAHEGGLLTVPSNDVVASALAAIGPDHDISGPEATRIINAATAGLEFDDLTRDNYVTAKSQGICALEFDPDLGFRVRTPVTTDLTPGKELAYRRRMADYIEWSIAAALKFFAGEPMTEEWEDGVNGAVEDFLGGMKAAPLRLIEDYAVDSESVNTQANKAQGIYYVKIRVRLWGIARHIVLMSQVGTTVEITETE